MFAIEALKILALLVLTADLGRGEATAQGLPGPAASGWYVLMFVNPSGGQTVGYSYVARCTAAVVPSSEGNGAAFGAGALHLTKRFGPYSTQQAGLQALVSAGWFCQSDVTGACNGCRGTFCTADVGCQ